MGLTYSTIIDGRRYLVTDTLAGDSLSKLLMQCRIDIKNPTAYMQPYQAGAQTVWLRGINPEQYIYIDLCNARNIKGKISLYYASRDTSNPIAARWDEKFFPVDKPMKEWIIEIEGFDVEDDNMLDLLYSSWLYDDQPGFSQTLGKQTVEFYTDKDDIVQSFKQLFPTITILNVTIEEE